MDPKALSIASLTTAVRQQRSRALILRLGITAALCPIGVTTAPAHAADSAPQKPPVAIAQQQPESPPGSTTKADPVASPSTADSIPAASAALPPQPQPQPEGSERDRGPYVRLGGGLDWSDPSRLRDRDCASTTPPALFGCGTGDNGRSLQALGSFTQTPVLDGAVGYRFTSWLRAEALLSWRPQLQFDGRSNFLGAGPGQSVSGSVSSLAGFAVAYVDLPRIGGVRPFLGAGIGAARNRLEGLEFRFPTIAADATTATTGGSSSGLATLLTAGIAVPLSKRLSLDLAYRFTDLGTVTGRSGKATVVRPRGTRSLTIAGTETDLQTQGLQMSLRYSF